MTESHTPSLMMWCGDKHVNTQVLKLACLGSNPVILLWDAKHVTSPCGPVSQSVDWS